MRLLPGILFLTLPLSLSAQSPRSDSIAVVAVAKGIIAADNARNLRVVLGYYHDDAMLLPPNVAPIEGLRNIRPNYVHLFETSDPALIAQVDEVVVVGDLAYVRGRNLGEMRSRDGAPARSVGDAYLMILRKRGGAWKISRLMWHVQKPAGT